MLTCGPHAGGVVQRVGVDPAADRSNSTRPNAVTPRLPPSPMTWRAISDSALTRTSDRAIADISIRLTGLM